MQQSRWIRERTSISRRGRWSTKEIVRLKGLYGLKDDAMIARELGRSTKSVQKMARQIFDGELRKGPWSVSEIANLRRYLGAAPVETIARILARPKEDVQARIVELARERRTGPWTSEDLNELKRTYGTRTDEDLAIRFGRRLEEVRRKARELCIAKDKAFLRGRGVSEATRMPRWTPEEIRLLRDLYPRLSNLEIAQRLNRSIKSVVSKAHHIELKKDPTRLEEMGRENVTARFRRRSRRERS